MDKPKAGIQPLWIGITLAVVAVATVGYVLLGKGEFALGSDQATEKVTVGVSATSLLPSLVHVAEAKGFFHEQGIDIEVKGYPTGKHALQATLKGELDMGTVAGPPIVLNSFKRNDFAVFATILDSAKHTRVLARKDRNIKSPQNLIGKKVATTLGTTAHFYMHEYLALNQIDASRIEVVNLKPKKMVEAIKNGDVDAIFAWEPNISKAQKTLAGNALLLPTMAGYKATFNLVSKRDYIKKNPEIIKKTLKALLKAEEFIKNNRKESIEIISSHTKSDSKIIDKLWDRYNFQLSLYQRLLLILEDQARWLIFINLTEKKEVPNYLEYIYTDALREVSPNDVTIIR